MPSKKNSNTNIIENPTNNKCVCRENMIRDSRYAFRKQRAAKCMKCSSRGKNHSLMQIRNINRKHNCKVPKTDNIFATGICDFVDSNNEYHALRAYEHEGLHYLMAGFYPKLGVLCHKNWKCKCGIHYPGNVNYIKDSMFVREYDGIRSEIGYVIITEQTGLEIVYKLIDSSKHSGFRLHCVKEPVESNNYLSFCLTKFKSIFGIIPAN